MAYDLTVIDSFTDRPFAGNPAAVAIVGRFPEEAEMQAIAREMNLSETAFAVARADGSYDLRWFTPTVEVDLCGHATLATAHALGGTARFLTRSGALACTAAGDGWIEMDFPADPPVAADLPPTLDVPDVRWCGRGRTDLLVEVGAAAAVRGFEPTANRLAVMADLGVRCVIVTAAGDSAGIDCVSRVFAPAAGIAEDPVTGSAHCTLSPFWSERLGRVELVGEQASPRGGIVRMRLAGDRVVLGGRAVTVSKVQMLV
ncbi:MAG TPA: PhzF family phenazine biosynthesis protein [Acidimicrobiales bacterium]|nr:PhzF family phenazine biosynthesis protein [Acidimicrobiales bacterium]